MRDAHFLGPRRHRGVDTALCKEAQLATVLWKEFRLLNGMAYILSKLVI